MITEQTSQIAFNKQVASRVFLMGLKSPEMRAAAVPGQFVMIRVRQAMDPLLRRPFSICRADGDLILVLYRVVGRGTEILSEMRQGDSLDVMGPLGRGFGHPPDGRRAILTAGGMGIAPLLFLGDSVGFLGCNLLAGFASSDQVIGPDRVGLLNVEMSVATDDGTLGRQGTVADLMEEHLSHMDPEPGMVFACGPIPMLKAIAAIAMRRDIPCQVSLETTMACGLGACQGCAVKASGRRDRSYWHVCREGPVFDARDLDWGAL
ncbi:MAG: dihydroorotate dehydrogenase electron transfer subunit [Deltaproteobacteria bacterium]|nr:dihydroorotate dehydrogenase electron transfer subunit [Deltaproteobacteria bacterium]OQX64743.1 MAG: hypothetical protein B5M55_05535 [Desulfococcus sp. 4484_242]